MDSQKAIDLIEKNEHIAIFLPKDPNLDCLISAEITARVLERRGKRIGFFGKTDTSDMANPEFFKKLASRDSLPREFIISINTEKSPVSQLRYENEQDKLKIVLSPKAKLIHEEDVSFGEGRIKCDCALMLGIKNIESQEEDLQIPPEFFTETPLINIDISEQNNKYGEADCVDEEKSSLSELIYVLFSPLMINPLDPESATLLLAGLIYKTGGFRNEKTSADTLLVASELMRLGAKNKDAFLITQQI